MLRSSQHTQGIGFRGVQDQFLELDQWLQLGLPLLHLLLLISNCDVEHFPVYGFSCFGCCMRFLCTGWIMYGKDINTGEEVSGYKWSVRSTSLDVVGARRSRGTWCGRIISQCILHHPHRCCRTRQASGKSALSRSHPGWRA